MTPFQQKDARWCAAEYTSTGDKSQTIGTSGCGLLSLVNAVYAITGGRVFLDPVELDKWAVKNGFRTANNGTDWGFFQNYIASVLGEDFGIAQTNSTEQAIIALQNPQNALIFCAGGDAHRIFTTSGHYMAINAYTDDGYFAVLDSDFYNGKYDIGERPSERRAGRLRLNTTTREIWASKSLIEQERSTGYIIVTYKKRAPLSENIKEDEDVIHWYTKVSELPDWARPAINADVKNGVMKLQEDGDSFSAPKSDIEIQCAVEAYRRLKFFGVVSESDLTKRA